MSNYGICFWSFIGRINHFDYIGARANLLKTEYFKLKFSILFIRSALNFRRKKIFGSTAKGAPKFDSQGPLWGPFGGP